jgi:hypothetical protein
LPLVPLGTNEVKKVIANKQYVALSR